MAVATIGARSGALLPDRLALATGGLVFVLLTLLGLVMKAAQARHLELDPAFFYQVMTAHGIGMVGTAGLTGLAVLWHFLGRHVALDERVFWTFLALFLAGVVSILAAVFGGGFAAAWTVVLLFVMAVYPHHLLQDRVMPGWALVIGQVLSYGSAVPLVVVTTSWLLANLHRSGIRFDRAAALLVLGVAGWTAGVMPAWIDGLIVVNTVMHNTLWVPGDFHMYLILGQVAMVWGTLFWLARDGAPRPPSRLERTALALYLLGGAGLTLGFLVAGAASVPRRWAVHDESWLVHDRIGVAFAACVLVAAIIFLVRTAPATLAGRPAARP